MVSRITPQVLVSTALVSLHYMQNLRSREGELQVFHIALRRARDTATNIVVAPMST